MDLKTLLELDKILEELREDLGSVSYEGIVEIPKGEKQKSDLDMFEFEYVDQKCHSYECDAFYGSIYLPIDDKFIHLTFEC